MVSVNVKRLLTLPHIFKLPEMLLNFICLMIASLGNSGKSLIGGYPEDDRAFGEMVIYGYFVILFVQIIGTIAGDKDPVQNTLFALFGFFFWIAIGSRIIHRSANFDTALALGSLCIINSFIFAAEGVLHGLNLRKDDD